MSGSTPVTVLVTDTCDDCASTQLNINALAFEQHFQNDLSIGQVNVQWQQVRQLHLESENYLVSQSQCSLIVARKGNGTSFQVRGLIIQLQA